jgi:hypothetical protein
MTLIHRLHQQSVHVKGLVIDPLLFCMVIPDPVHTECLSVDRCEIIFFSFWLLITYEAEMTLICITLDAFTRLWNRMAQ